MTSRKRQAGFGLVNLVVAFSVTLVLLGMLTQANRSTGRLTSASMTLSRLDEAASQAAQMMSSELRWAQPDTMLITPENGSDRVDILVAEGYDGTATIWSDPITFTYEPSPIDSNENGAADEGNLVRLQGTSRRVLCRNVPFGGLSIVRTGNRVDIELSITKLSRDKALLEGNVQTSVTLVNRNGA